MQTGNIVFCPLGNEAFLIDFDFTEAAGCKYHEDYNHEVNERHPDIKSKKTNTKRFCHDEYALNYIAQEYFRESVYPDLS